ncbi:MAG: betaine/proline/choline family ABC transporter ATP-binding protein [Firmicutes bacterium]|nr:betaine/proline/choline family ABC transporter ATP-binding protein [Bacillota bacterium]
MIWLEQLTKIYETEDGSFTAVDGLDLHIQRGEFVVLIGPSGCGKTTTLKMVNRLIEPTSGRIYINGHPADQMNPVMLRRNIGYVIQNIGLFPHMTIAQNVGIVPHLKQWPREKKHEKVTELLAMVGLDPDVYYDRYPGELSGGQQQRIGVLRALASEPDIILMDEPFGALDPITREQLQDELKQLQEKLKKTIVFVTHDMDEALKIADRIVLMREGKPVQVATPSEMIAHPANQFVREFIGEEHLAPQPENTAVSSIMIPEPLTVDQTVTPREAMQRMRKAGVGLAVVTDTSHQLLGIVTADAVQEHLHETELPVGKIVDDGLQAVSPKVSVQEAAEMLANGQQKILPIIDHRRRPLGLVTRSSLIKGVVNVFWNNHRSA